MARRKLLICEDEVPIRNVLRMKATTLGYEVECASSGDEGLVTAPVFRPDVIITDHKMPGLLNGIQMIKAVKSIEGFDDVPIILLTGSVVAEYTFSVELGGLKQVMVLPKPFKMKELFGLIESLFDDDGAAG